MPGEALRASTTTPIKKLIGFIYGNDVRYSKNVEDWVIRNQAPKVEAMEKVQRLEENGFE
jgi:hypothetical protein